jgi:hypothetical protein
MTHNECPHFACHILSTKYVLLKNTIHHKMQCEKLYNLHRVAYFTIVIFVFKIDKILSD